MRQLIATFFATVILFPGTVAAQIKTLPGETITLTATVDAIEASTRAVRLRGADGHLVWITAPPEMKRFAELKVGDRITARYYVNVTLRLKKPGEPAVDTDSTAVTPGTGPRPGATSAAQRVVTATITAIDLKVPSITLAGPNKWTYSSKVEDVAALKQLKVGDRLDITWTEAVLVSAEAPKP